jgi:hypothetical protein
VPKLADRLLPVASPSDALIIRLHKASALLRVRAFRAAAEEVAALGDLDSPSYSYKAHAASYSGKHGACSVQTAPDDAGAGALERTVEACVREREGRGREGREREGESASRERGKGECRSLHFSTPRTHARTTTTSPRATTTSKPPHTRTHAHAHAQAPWSHSPCACSRLSCRTTSPTPQPRSTSSCSSARAAPAQRRMRARAARARRTSHPRPWLSTPTCGRSGSRSQTCTSRGATRA